MTVSKKVIAAPAAIALYTSVKLIEAAIVSARTMGETYQRELNKIALSVLNHMAKHKDVRLVNKFLESVVESVRANALRSWFETFGNMKYDTENKCMKYDGSRKVRLGEAMGNPFWKFEPEAEYVPIDVSKAVAVLLKRIQSDAKKTGRNHAKYIKGLEALVPANAIAA